MPIFDSGSASGLLPNFSQLLLLQLAVCATNSINEPETENIYTHTEVAVTNEMEELFLLELF